MTWYSVFLLKLINLIMFYNGNAKVVFLYTHLVLICFLFYFGRRFVWWNIHSQTNATATATFFRVEGARVIRGQNAGHLISLMLNLDILHVHFIVRPVFITLWKFVAILKSRAQTTNNSHVFFCRIVMQNINILFHFLGMQAFIWSSGIPNYTSDYYSSFLKM